jgi:Trypsin-like peptidase domain
MTNVLTFIEKNAIKIVLTATLILGVFLGCLYVSTIKRDVCKLGKMLVDVAELQSYTIDQLRDAQSNADATKVTTFKALMIIIEQLEDIAKTQQYIIDQNRDKNASSSKSFKNSGKPTYEEIRSHSVWIEGCSGGKNHDDKLAFPLDEENGMCWGGTGTIIKVTETETYIMTNAHVTGKGQENVKLYVENDATHKLVKAEIVAQHTTVDVAVIKIAAQLPGKKAIPGIATARIQDPVYVVGNPLGVRDVYSEGVVAGYEGVDLLLQMPCIYGNSGSGVFNSSGKLVGVVYALEGYSGFMGIPEVRITHSLVVDSVSIKAFLKDLGLYND